MRCNLAHVEPKALHLMWVLAEAGFEARLCGGAVRDLLLGKTPKDWDIATTARPEQVIQVMAEHTIPTIPTGLQHGTITAVMGGEPFEITTLRIDQDTDGRHATVEFTQDWKADACRRDFTINAMYLDAEGILHDYFDGVADLDQQVVRFVGKAEDRIQEDYLRILRYFRFRARMGVFTGQDASYYSEAEADALNAISKHSPGLSQISGERIWSEIKQIIMLQDATHDVFKIMQTTGVLRAVGLEKMYRFEALKRITREDQRPAVVLASTFERPRVTEFLALLKTKYRASNDEIKPVEFFVKNEGLPLSIEEAYRLLATHQQSDVLGWLAIGGDVPISSNPAGWYSVKISSLYRQVAALDIPLFPVSGEDLMAVGIPVGPHMGATIRRLREIWSASKFTLDKVGLISAVYPEGSLLEVK